MPVEIPQGFIELLLAGNSLGHVELPSYLMALFVEGDGMTGSGQFGCCTQACGSGADNSDSTGSRCTRVQRPLAFVCCPWIDQARCDLLFENLIKAGLIAADARVDFIGSIGLGFDDQVGISEERPRH